MQYRMDYVTFYFHELKRGESYALRLGSDSDVDSRGVVVDVVVLEVVVVDVEFAVEVEFEEDWKPKLLKSSSFMSPLPFTCDTF
jgi:hypothetical protein